MTVAVLIGVRLILEVATSRVSVISVYILEEESVYSVHTTSTSVRGWPQEGLE